MDSATDQIQELIDREGLAWDEGDVEKLLSIFHPDAVWVWPQTRGSLDPLDWDMTVGKYDPARWQQGFSRIFSSDILRNLRHTHSIKISPEQDGAVAVVDVDIEWRTATGSMVRWAGRAMKYFVRTDGGWKLIAHTGL